MCFDTLPSRKSGGFRTGFLLQNQSTYSKLNPGETEVWVPGSPLKKILDGGGYYRSKALSCVHTTDIKILLVVNMMYIIRQAQAITQGKL